MNSIQMFSDIKEGSFVDFTSSGTLEGMSDDYVPSWDQKINWRDELDMKDRWNYDEAY